MEMKIYKININKIGQYIKFIITKSIKNMTYRLSKFFEMLF